MVQHLAIYARLSQDRDGTQTATARQVADCRALAAAKGWPVAGVYEDTDLTAYRRVNRPAYERLLAYLEAGEVDGVLVWKLDRLVRHPAEFERFWAVCERRGAILASVHEPVDTSSELGLVIVRILVAFARHHGVIVGEGNWPPILDHGTFEQLTLALTTVYGRALGPPRRYLLTGGIARCGLCDAPLMARPNKAGKPRYICAKAPGRPGCGGITVGAEPLEMFVAEAIFTALDTPAFSAALHRLQTDDHDAALAAVLHADEEALERLHVDHYVDRIIDRAGFIVAKRALEERIAKAREQLARRSRTTLLTDLPLDAAAARAAWDRQNVEWRRAFVKISLEAVRVHRGRPGRLPFNPERVELVWRG